MEKTIEFLLWEQCFGDVEYAIDFAGRRMKRSDFADIDSELGWNIYHILPVQRQGKNRASNFHPVNNLTSDEKGVRTTFRANNRYFTIVLTKNLTVGQKEKTRPYFFQKKYAIIPTTESNYRREG